MQLITRKFEFDAGHRVMNERVKCFSNHGHRYYGDLVFEFTTTEEIGYNIDFKEIKRVGCQWIDDYWDHGTLLNPHDTKLIDVLREINTKVWLMSLNGEGNYCNPTVENLSRELFLAQQLLFQSVKGLSLHQIRMYETPNCWTDCFNESISDSERINFLDVHKSELVHYGIDKGVFEYDDRKL